MMIVVKSPKDLSINKQRERHTPRDESTAEIVMYFMASKLWKFIHINNTNHKHRKPNRRRKMEQFDTIDGNKTQKKIHLVSKNIFLRKFSKAKHNMLQNKTKKNRTEHIKYKYSLEMIHTNLGYANSLKCVYQIAT